MCILILLGFAKGSYIVLDESNYPAVVGWHQHSFFFLVFGSFLIIVGERERESTVDDVF